MALAGECFRQMLGAIRNENKFIRFQIDIPGAKAQLAGDLWARGDRHSDRRAVTRVAWPLILPGYLAIRSRLEARFYPSS